MDGAPGRVNGSECGRRPQLLRLLGSWGATSPPCVPPGHTTPAQFAPTVDDASHGSSRAIYDDAQAAYRDPAHPCHGFVDLQDVSEPGDDPSWVMPIPFLGTTANQWLMFLGLNPSYSKGGSDPRIGSSYETWDRWARSYFQTYAQALAQPVREVSASRGGGLRLRFWAGAGCHRFGVHPFP